MAWTTDEVTTDRLLLRPLVSEDWPMLRRILIDPVVREFLGGPVGDELVAKLSTSELGDQEGAFADHHPR